MTQKQCMGAPLHAWLALSVGLFGVSSAGAVFSLFRQVSPLLRASWRLWATGLLQVPPTVYQVQSGGMSMRHLLGDARRVALVVVSGAFLAVHFGAWVWSIDHTSLTHSLLWVTSHPIVLASGAWIAWAVSRLPRFSRAHPPRRPSLAETAGATVGFLGGVVMVLGAEDDEGVTIAGDAAAFLGAVAMAVYLLIGRALRADLPVFVYACPVTLLAALILSVAAAVAESASFAPPSAQRSLLGWFFDAEFLLYVLVLAVASGLGGHTVLNYVLKHLDPLVVSVTLLLEPLVGSLVGAAFGMQGVPGPFTWLGGSVLLVGAAMVTAGQARRDRAATAQTHPEDGAGAPAKGAGAAGAAGSPPRQCENEGLAGECDRSGGGRGGEAGPQGHSEDGGGLP